jgi:hypothetical protein
MRVFCPEHKRGFFAPRQNPIKCENRGHALGDLNFAGGTGPQVDLQWQYCCNCEHFCPITPEQQDLRSCPVCTRRVSLLYICDRCFTITYESETPLETKNFTLNAEGLPQPSCPGCLQANSAEVREHICDELGSSFTTALNTCPICRERLDVGPTFPSLVSQYLRKTKNANKHNATFDYDTGLFVEVDDGEFVIVTEGPQSKQAIILPRTTRFADTREFYEIYQDYYHHASQLKAGDVRINEPALAERSGDGWKFQLAGMLDVVSDQPKVKREKIRLSDSEAPVAPKATPPAAAPQEAPSAETCTECGSLVEARYAFCWHCGHPMKRSGAAPPAPAPARSTARRFVIDVDDASTAQPEAGDSSSPFRRDPRGEPRKFRRGPNPALKLLLIIGFTGATLLLATGGIFWLKDSGSRSNASTLADAAAVKPGPAEQAVPAQEVADSPTATPVALKPATHDAEEDLRKLRQRRITVTASDRSATLRDFSKTEKQYPGDYRFTYERAKLAVTGTPPKAFDAAFQALFLAAEKAIRAGKAQEMLHTLDTDKSGDFRKISRGRSEWTQVVQALKNKDMKMLAASMRIAAAE